MKFYQCKNCNSVLVQINKSDTIMCCNKTDYIMATKFYKCRHCGNVIVKFVDSKVPVVCCGEKMEELIPGTVEASHEKHLPVVSISNNLMNVSIGSVTHPMSSDHLIEWVFIEYSNGGEFIYLNKLVKYNIK